MARNLYLSQEERNRRLAAAQAASEAWLALRLESHFSKKQILTLYLNTTYYGHLTLASKNRGAGLLRGPCA